jgi:hypothetical protein
VAVDVIAVEPISGRWASLADLHNGMLGTVPSDNSVSVRLCGKPLDWLAADGSTAAGLGAWPPAICILDSGADAVEELLLERALILDDREHADEIDRCQAIRNRIIARMPAGGDPTSQAHRDMDMIESAGKPILSRSPPDSNGAGAPVVARELHAVNASCSRWRFRRAKCAACADLAAQGPNDGLQSPRRRQDPSIAGHRLCCRWKFLH